MIKTTKLIIELAAIFLISCLNPVEIFAQPTDSEKPNILFIMADQQRFDALRRAQDELSVYQGKLKIRTPNLDRLSREGVYFRNAYTNCAVCAPTRTSLRTGLTLEHHGAQTNSLVEKSTYTKNPNLFQSKIESAETIDQILVEDLGYVSEYYGKWHLPEDYLKNRAGTDYIMSYNTFDFSDSSFSLVADRSWGNFYKDYLNFYNNRGEISKTYPDGSQQNTFSKYAYYPVQLDVRYGMPTNTRLTSPPFESWETSQPNVIGEDDLGEKYTPSGMNGFIGVQALGRLCQQDNPFFLTISFHNPHAPMVASKKYFDYYFENRKELLIPPSILDELENSGYDSDSKMIKKGIQDPDKLREWMACYYALVEEVDHWVGEILDTLEAYPDVRKNTIVVFLSDHGEMLGAHSLREKSKFFEESAHVPLIINAPEKINPGTVVDESVNTIDVFATLLDYVNASSANNSDGKSLRRFIEKSNYNKEFDEEHIVTEWDYRDPNGSSLTRSLGGEINFLSKKGPYKLMMTKKANSSKIDMLYNIEEDPYEVHNLIGKNGNTASNFVIGKTEHLKALLIDWMLRMDGEGKAYSDPKWNNNEGDGDIEEITNRRTWRTMDLWISDTALMIGDVVDVDGVFTRNEWLYLGRTTNGTTTVSSISIEGSDADLFSISEFTSGSISMNEYKKIKVQFTPPVTDYKITDARLRIVHDAGEDKVLDLMNTDPETNAEIVIDPCDEIGNWTGGNDIQLNTNNQQEGQACLEISGSSTEDFRKVFTSPVNTGLMTANSKLQFWYFVSDTSLLSEENQVDLGSAGAADADEYNWSIDKANLINGWNFISLALADANVIGNPDLNAINWFRLYRVKKASVSSRLDNILLFQGEEEPPGAPSLIYPGDGSEGVTIAVSMNWLAGQNAYEHEIYFDTINPPKFVGRQSGTSFNPDPLKSDKRYYWQIKEKNPSGITAGEVWNFKTLGPPNANYGFTPSDGSTGESTTIALHWYPGGYAESHDVYFGTSNPPPFIKNQPGNSYTPDEPLDYETTYYWRVDALNEAGKNEGEVISFTTREKDASGIIVISDCDSQNGWGGTNNPALNSSQQKQGAGCLQASGSGTNDFQRTFDPPFNTGVSEADAQLVFWYYISNVSNFDNSNQVEIGSAGKNDEDEYNWQLDASTLNNGWNLMRLDFSDANKMGSPNLRMINWFRLYRRKTGTVTSRIDNIRIIDKSVNIPFPGKAEGPVPDNNSTNVATSPALSWTSSELAEFHLVYFGTTNPPKFIGEQPGSTYRPSGLDSATTYYWRIDEVNMTDVTEGDVWNFTTIDGSTTYRNALQSNKFSLSPNPCRGITILDLDFFEDEVLVNVFDMQGRLVYRTVTEEHSTRLNLTNLHSGNYIVEVKNGRDRSAAIISVE